jgi:hypothetical protein
MTKAQAAEIFRNEIIPGLVLRYGRQDHVAIAEAWNNFTDMLHKDGEITAKQYDTWTNPF